MEKKTLVIFDFDGVLVNTTDLNFRISKSVNPEMSKEYYHALSLGNFHENIKKATKDDGYVVHPEWMTKYSEGLLELTTHDIIRNLVKDISELHPLAIVSSTYSSSIREFLKQEDIEHCFTDVLGSDVHTSKTIKIQKLLDGYSIPPENALFITDTLGDIREGNECKVLSIGVTWGSHDSETLMLGKPFAVVDTVPELESEISRFFAKTQD